MPLRRPVTVLNVIDALKRQLHLRITVIDSAAVQHKKLPAPQPRNRTPDLLTPAIPPAHPVACMRPAVHGPILAYAHHDELAARNVDYWSADRGKVVAYLVPVLVAALRGRLGRKAKAGDDRETGEPS
jgi:hypothetical protein